MNRLRTAVCCGLLFLIAAVAGRALAFPQILIGFSSTGCTAPSTVQSSGLVPFAPSTGNFAQITLTSVVAGHDIIVQAFAFGGPVSSAPSISVTESSGSVVYSQDTYAQITPASSEYYQVGIYRLHNAAAGTHVITIANSAGTFNSYGDASAIEAANVSATAPVINSNSNISGSSNPTTGSATPAANCSISISTVSMASLSSSETFGHPPSGYTSIAVNTNGTQGPNNSQVGSADYLIQSSTATPQNPSYATFTAAKPWVAALAIYSGVGGGSGPLNAIKWHPGFYMGSSVLTNAPNVGGNNSYRQSTEIPALRSGPSQVLGETCYYFWTNFENTTAGVYSFSAIDSDYVALTGYVSGSTTSAVYSAPRRMNIYFVQTDYFSANPTTRGTVPSYMLASSSYGPGPGGGSGYGYWTTTGASGLGGGSTIAYWRPAVIARLQALMTAMANHVLPDGYTVDTSPYIEWVKPYLETSDPPANSNTVYGSAADPTFSTNGFMTQLQAINTTMASVFPHTNYAAPANFTAGDPTGNGTEDVTLVQSLPAVRGGVGGPDVFGFSDGQNPGCSGGNCGLSFGMGAYIGLVPPASGNPFTTPWVANNGTLVGVDQRGVIPFLATVQGSEVQGGSGEVAYAVSDIIQQMNSTLHATHQEIVFIGNGQQCSGSSSITTCLWYGSAAGNPSSWNSSTSGGALAAIVQSSVANTTCPSSYAACNTH